MQLARPSFFRGLLIFGMISLSFSMLPQQVLASSSDDSAAQTSIQVLIDPGHGGIDKGGRTIGNTYEEPIVFDVAEKLHQELKTLGLSSQLIREPDEGLGLLERVQLALKVRPKIFVSLHANTHRNKKIRGAEFYIEPAESLLGHQDFLSFLSITNTSDNLSHSVLQSYNTRFFYPELDKYPLDPHLKVILLDMIRMKTRGDSLNLAVTLKQHWQRPAQVREGNFYLLRSLPFPSVLVELGYISNEKDFKILNDEKSRQDLAKQLAQGLSKYLSLNSKDEDATK